MKQQTHVRVAGGGFASLNLPPHQLFTMFYMYILKSDKDKDLYIGFTNDIEKRIEDHNSGKNISTRSRRPFKLLYYEAHISKEDALRRERYFKTAKGKTTLHQILRNSFSSF